MTFSLGEVAAMAKKAARGAGYSWGLAEEAAGAVRWLSAQGFDGCGALARLLERVDGRSEACRPDVAGPVWRSEAGEVCPLIAGTALADRATTLAHLHTRIAGVVSPLLLLPFCADAARVTGRAVRLASPGQALVTDGAVVSGSPVAAWGDVDISFGAPIGPPRPTRTRAKPDPADWALLDRFASRTYAPATEASRRLGAGAGTTDND